VHPDQVIRQQHRRKLRGQQRVHPLIGSEVPAGELDEIEPVVKKRPQGGVAEAVVVAVVVFTGKVDRAVGQRIRFGNLGPRRSLCGYFAAPAEPYSSGVAQSIEHAGDQAAAGLCPVRPKGRGWKRSPDGSSESL